MSNEHGIVSAIFNGEIYNHPALRRNLQAHVHIFRGRVAEVLLVLIGPARSMRVSI